MSASWTVPGDAVSGIYFAHLVREDGPSGESHIFFVVRDDDGRSDLLFQTSDTTWQAYNAYGGNSLYTAARREPARRARVQGLLRPPVHDARQRARGLGVQRRVPDGPVARAQRLRRLLLHGVDSDRLGAELLEHRAFLSVGHDEYWSATQRANVTAARDAGVNLAFFSGNEVFWKTRWENNRRTLVTYKETHAERADRPDRHVDRHLARPALQPSADGGRPENALTGQLFTVNGDGTTSMEVPAAEGKLRFWRHTSIAGLASGQIATLPHGTLGYEWDEDVDNGFRPAGLVPGVVDDQAATCPCCRTSARATRAGRAVHNMTLYRAPSGARVFGAGTVQWSWGLDSSHDRGAAPADARMQQATANLFADMGAHGATLQSDLTSPSCSSDATGPTAQITSQGAGTAQGTAADTGGGRVAGVEVSTDGGSTWHPAEGRESWRYTWSPATDGNVRVRAVDDSGNLGPGQSHATPASCGGGGPSSGGGTPGGGSSGGGPSGSGSVKPRPKPRAFVTARRVRVSRDGLVTLRIKCSGGKTACKVRLRLQLKGRTFVGRRVVISAGAPRPVRLFVSRSVRRKLALKGALRVTAVASVPDGTGRRTVTRTAIRLLASRGR